MSKTLMKGIGGLVVLVVTTIAGISITNGYDWVLSLFDRSSPIRIDFQAMDRCPSGLLANLSRHFDDQSVKLEWGADRLIICDPDSLQTNAADAPRDIASAFPGCLKFSSGSMKMLRSSPAVCELHSGVGYICDGDAAATYPGSSALGTEGVAVNKCNEELLVRFGFEPKL